MFPALWAHPDSLAFFYEVASGRKSILGTDHPCNDQSTETLLLRKWAIFFGLSQSARRATENRIDFRDTHLLEIHAMQSFPA